MPLLIIIPRKYPPTLPTLERSLARMTPQIALRMKAPRKPLITQIVLLAQFRNHLRLRSEGFRLVRSLGIKHLLVLLEILVGGESEFSNRAFREEVVGGPIVAVNVLIAGLGYLEALVEVEVVWARTLEVFLAVEKLDFFGLEVVGRGERFDHAAVPHDDFVKSFDTYLFPRFRALSIVLSLHTTSAGEIYGLLNCGPEHNTEQIVGIPLHKAVSGTLSDEYLRPQGHYPVLRSKTTSSVLAKAIHIRMERQSRAHEATSRRYWLYVDGYKNINLKLTDVYPSVRWENSRTMIAKANDSDGNITRRYLARFRTQGEGSRDVVVVLEFEIQGLQAQARCHVMTSSRGFVTETHLHEAGSIWEADRQQ